MEAALPPADEFGMGFCAWAMEELFRCEYWADTSALIKQGAVFPVGSKRPDFVCGFADGTLGVFEAKGTTGTPGSAPADSGLASTLRDSARIFIYGSESCRRRVEHVACRRWRPRGCGGGPRRRQHEGNFIGPGAEKRLD